jgi:membrane-associated phospholipid phosphatase
MEPGVLLFFHAHASPILDALFRASHVLGDTPFCTVLVLTLALAHWLKSERRESGLWLLLGATTFLLLEGLKYAVARSRPELWPRLVTQGGFSFPSGHATATATFYPLLAWIATRQRPRLRVTALALSVAFALFVGLGRLYLGLHWPSDVLAGWALGATQSSVAIAWLRRQPLSPPGQDGRV